jgi:hypothetical protein
MVELTPEDREQIQHQIVQYKEQKLQEQKNPLPVAPPSTPDGLGANEALEEALKQGANPDKKEARRVKKRIKGIWNNWRTITLDAKSLEQEKIACQIAIERAETQAKLDKIRREEEVAEAQHWLELNKGNLEEIDANTTSKPHKAWYNLRRFCHHITKITDNVPKVFKNLFWIGVVIVGILLTRRF